MTEVWKIEGNQYQPFEQSEGQSNAIIKPILSKNCKLFKKTKYVRIQIKEAQENASDISQNNQRDEEDD